MKLVKMEDYQLKVADEILLLKPFKNLYKQDRSKNKDSFLEFLTLVYFVFDPRSDYSYIINEEQRIKEVCESNGIKYRKFTPIEKECIELYKKLTYTSSQGLLNSTKIAVSKVQEFLENVDLRATDDKGKPLYTVSAITTTIKQIPQLSRDIMEAEKAVQKELEERGEAVGGNERKSLMDDGVFL